MNGGLYNSVRQFMRRFSSSGIVSLLGGALSRKERVVADREGAMLMKLKITDLKTRFDIIGAIILVTGLLYSLCIYLTADDVVDNVFGNELEESKRYIHSLELYGGKANVLATEITQWFNSLWHGQ